MRRLLIVAVLLTSGCAAERAANIVAAAIPVAVQTIAEKSSITQSAISADGEIQDPEYRFDLWGGPTFMAGGTIRVVGVRVKGQFSGSGAGPDKPLSPETLQAFRDWLKHDPTVQQLIQDAIKENKP